MISWFLAKKLMRTFKLMSRNFYFLFSFVTILSACTSSTKISTEIITATDSEIVCTAEKCEGEYIGPEFENGSDVAHQFSNKMASKVGDQLKALYKKGRYSKVDFSRIFMSTEGMGSGNVTYKLTIPFMSVTEKCDAFTSFDHVGGWNHSPALSSRKKQLSKALLPGETLVISDLKTTPEGLQEYWIQWKNKEIQEECK